MQLLFVHSHKFMKYEQKYYTTGQFPYELFKTRYLNNFGKVIISSRVTEIADVKNYDQSDGKNVFFRSLPNLSVLKNRHNAIKSTKEILEQEIRKTDIVVARMPSGHAYIAIKIAIKLGKPLVVEVVGDVFESLWNHGSIFGKILAPISAIKYKRIIRSSKYSIYVTEKQLQRKYPSSKDSYTINASNVELEPTPQSVLSKRIKKEKNRSLNTLNIGLIGSYSSKYKGIHNGIDLIESLWNQGIHADLHILGHGNKEWLLDRAKKRGVEKNIHFHGLLPTGEPVIKWLDELDLYIQPSLTEGLPRALIEAMSRGLPAVASNVGGIPELLDSKFLHKPNNSEDLFNKVTNLIENRELTLNQIEENFSKAQDYSSDNLRERRSKFWEYFIEREIL